jgi:hypothetical protein
MQKVAFFAGFFVSPSPRNQWHGGTLLTQRMRRAGFRGLYELKVVFAQPVN